MRSIVSARAFAAFAAVAFVAFFAGAALAAQPQPWQLGMQPSASPIKDFIASFHNMLLVIITLITIFVLALLLYTMVRFRASANPNPSISTPIDPTRLARLTKTRSTAAAT